jgi:inorganic pyrophosphatase
VRHYARRACASPCRQDKKHPRVRARGTNARVDRGQADDKIIAVLKDDPAYGDWSDIYQCPPTLLYRLRHYFLTYKEVPGESGGLWWKLPRCTAAARLTT